MRCMACGAEMILIKIIEDESMAVPGFERHAYMCSACPETETRLAFNKDAKSRQVQIAPNLPSPGLAPAAPIDNRPRASGFFLRAFAKLRGQQSK
jgi:hypothetical protein